MNMFRIILISIFYAVIFHSLAAASSLTKDQVGVSAYWLEGPIMIVPSEKGAFREPADRTLIIYITNKTNKTFRMPTELFTPERKKIEGRHHVLLKWGLAYFSSRYDITIPCSKMGIVELRKNETAVLNLSIPKDWPIDEKPESLSIDISDKICERYNVDYFAFSVAIK